MSQYSSFTELFQKCGRPVITSHSTYIGRYPENTLPGIKASLEAGADFVEFDVRTTKDGIPVLIHDETLERTANVPGHIKDFTFAELQKLNFSHYQYFVDCSGRTLPQPQMEYCPITSLEEALAEYGQKIFLNIQIYEQDPAGLKTICGMFREHDLYERAYFTMLTFQEGEKIRAIDPDIELCVLERTFPNAPTSIAKLHEFHDFGCRIAQPRWFDITPEYCDTSRKLGIWSNVYYANTARDAQRFTECGIDGILTDYPELLVSFQQNK